MVKAGKAPRLPEGSQGRMTEQTTTNVPTRDEPRLLRAQLDMIVQYLPLSLWINPSWAFISIVPFLGFFHVFGYVPLWRLFAVVGVHFVSCGCALLFHRAYSASPDPLSKWVPRLTFLQGTFGVCWGLMPWLLWQNGNAVNNIYIAVPIIAVLWSYANSRAMHSGIYLMTVLPIFVMTLTRMFTGTGETAFAMGVMLTLIFLYTGLVAFGAKRQVENLLLTRFANDDMTVDLRHAHDEALRKRYEAEAANASKTTFLANMSHELRTPLNAILGFSDIIANERLGMMNMPRYKEYAGDINASGTHLLNIINDILDIAKIESGKMEIAPTVIDARVALDSAITFVAGRARERRQTVELHVAEDAPLPYADERALTQIAINLLSNAIKFTQEGGHVDVFAHGRDGGFELCVSDNGPGIALEQQENIFKPFNQIDNRYSRNVGGTGLGLSLVRGLAELHGGKAWIESALGEGTRAYVYFPVANAPEKRAKARA
jgi:two-component system cell cycle sensor histidine kinase PleC